MPIYDFECPDCQQQFEQFLTIAESARRGDKFPCPVCGHDAKKIIVLGHGGVLRQDSTWVRGVASMLSDDERRPLPINTVAELRDYYAKNPNIRPRESHPAFASSLGDVQRPMGEQERKDSAKKLARQRISEMRAITINTPQPASGQSATGPASTAG